MAIILNVLSIVNKVRMLELFRYNNTSCFGSIILISYEPLFETMRKKGITEYNLIYKQGLSANTIHRIKKGLPFTTETLDTLCDILDCEVSDILRHDKT